MKKMILLALGSALLTVTAFDLSAYNVALSPRAAANQITSVKGSEPMMANCPMAGSPKSPVAAADNAPMGCCGMAMGKCSGMSTGPGSH